LIRQLDVINYVRKYLRPSFKESTFRDTVYSLLVVLSDQELIDLYHKALYYGAWGIAEQCKEILCERGIILYDKGYR